MGKIAKRIFIVLVIVFVGLGSFYLGLQSGGISDNYAYTDDKTENFLFNEEKLNNIENKLRAIDSIIDKKFLYDYEQKQLEEGIYKGYLASLNDIYTEYYTQEEFKALNEQSEGSFGGVGIEVSGMDGQFIEVIAPIKGTPAAKAGIKAKDKIIKIDGQDFLAKDLNEAVKLMRGEPGQEVVLTIQRMVDDQAKTMDFKLVREIINVESVHYQMLEENIAYINISNFQAHTAEDFKAAYKELKGQGADRLILDLRNNPGGLLDVTLEIADFLLPQGNIMSVNYKDETQQNYKSDKDAQDLAMVTLINGGSASASEVLSGALKDYKRSIIIGEKSFGKGVVQQVIPLGDDTGVKVTVAEYFSPNKNKIHGVGIKPDIEVKLDESVKAIGVEALSEDKQLQKAIEVIKTK
ncbi:MAG: S41 family peptidase [Tissierellia bacterium]|nr:S41 family peptidase [Tissierellia bacterium]